MGTAQRRSLVVCLGLALAIAVVYSPVRHCGFVSYDDSLYITENPHLPHGLTLRGLGWAFTTPLDQWMPVTWLARIVEYRLFGLNAGADHLVNVAFHLINALLLFNVLSRMTAEPWRSALVAAYKNALRITPDDPYVQHDLGALDLQTGQYGPAAEHLLLAVQLRPDYVEAYNDLGTALWRAGRIQDARKWYERAIRLRPDFALAHYNLGGALEQTGQRTEAMAQYHEALRLKPDLVEAQKRLAELQAAR